MCCRRRGDYAHRDRQDQTGIRETLAIHLCYHLDKTAISSDPQRRPIVPTMRCSNIAGPLALVLLLSTDAMCCHQDSHHVQCPLT